LDSILLVFFLDAVRFDYINPTDTPFLSEMAENGVSGPLETILGFDGIAATIFTGTYPSQHGIWSQCRMASAFSPFDWLTPLIPYAEKIDQGLKVNNLTRKLFRLGILEISRFRANMTHFPGVPTMPISLLPKLEYSFDRKIEDPGSCGRTLTLFDILRNNNVSFEAFDDNIGIRDQLVLHNVLKNKLPSKVMYIRLKALDEITHCFGISSPKRKEVLRRTDYAISKIVSHFKQKGFNPICLAFADHGMMDIRQKLDVYSNLKKIDSRDYTAFLDSTMARFWGSEKVIKKISASLDTSQGRILLQTDYAKYHLPYSRLYGDLVYLVNPGTIIMPNCYQEDSNIKAMHGYDPATPEMDTFFVMSGKDVAGPQVSRIKLLDILPTILDTLELSIPKECAGRSLYRRRESTLVKA
jgi:predicted AlkP superfamily pyrophosphatase or phosphodiesterase